LRVILSEVSIANESKDLGQLRDSEAGTGSVIRRAFDYARGTARDPSLRSG